MANKEKFIKAAREAECDETGEAFDRAFAKIVPPKPRPASAKAPKARQGARKQ